MSLEKRLRYLEKAWKQRLAGQGEVGPEISPEVTPDRGEAGRETGRTGGETGATTPDEPFTVQRGWEAAGAYCLRRRLHFPSPLAETRISQFLLPAGYTAPDLLFFDTETTGLSGGAGNSIFLMGMAWIEAGALSVEQVFLKDFPGEGEFLSLLAGRLNRHRVFVSYNGRAFDAHVLRTRFLLNRMALELEQQTDLLYWSRRLWRRVLPDCSLSTVEREILGIRRELDVPGFEVPGIYLEFLRSGRPGRLDAVLEHNLQDVRTLADLLVTVNSILLCRDRPGAAEPAGEADRSAGTGTADRTALGSFFLSRDESWGVELLKSAFS
ncbi:MAG: ribonuclease H-like domain-containing protein, partial [Spirochaetales bacterium]|nr:ribonuclease H-like domain-containing protein [Spirochaetales bacterium]